MESQRKYWFPAKRYGWGWGICPACPWAFTLIRDSVATAREFIS